jgi:hypothetical protein
MYLNDLRVRIGPQVDIPRGTALEFLVLFQIFVYTAVIFEA